MAIPSGMADETLIEGYCERCLEDDIECHCLCETMEWCIKYDCHCILRNAVGKEDLDRINTYLEMLSKAGGILDMDWRMYDCNFLCGLEFLEITDTLREYRMDIQELDAEIQKLNNEWQELYDSLYNDDTWVPWDYDEKDRESKKEEKRYISQEIQKLEKIRRYYNERKNTFQWKCYLIFKKHNAEYVF